MSLRKRASRSSNQAGQQFMILFTMIAAIAAYNTFFSSSKYLTQLRLDYFIPPVTNLTMGNRSLWLGANQSNDTISPTNSTEPTIVNEPAICNENTPESIRASGVHWHVKAADVNVSMYNMMTGQTVGVMLTSRSGRSPEILRQHVGRTALFRQQEQLMRSNTTMAKFLPKMNYKEDIGKAPAYDKYLGCTGGQKPSGTAVVVVQNFYCPNVWHAFANLNGIWLLMQVVKIKYASIILPREYGSPFKVPEKYAADALWPLYIQNNSEEFHMQTNCFERLLFMETPRYRPGPYWELMNIHIRENLGERCSRGSNYMKTHSSFHTKVRAASTKALGLQSDTSNQTQLIVCYMSRRLREKRVRYFSQKLGVFVENSLDAWADKKRDLVIFERLEFNEQVPFAKQVERARKCDILFGPHGAGLGHQIWMGIGGKVIEFGDDKKCSSYYEAMASWYGHSYTCLSGHGISIDKNQVYQSFNVTLLLEVLNDAVSGIGTSAN